MIKFRYNHYIHVITTLRKCLKKKLPELLTFETACLSSLILTFYYAVVLTRVRTTDDDNSISAIDSCLDRDRPRDVSPAARGREYRRRRSVLVPQFGPRAAQSVFVRELHPIFEARVCCHGGRQRCRILQEPSIGSACDTLRAISAEVSFAAVRYRNRKNVCSKFLHSRLLHAKLRAIKNATGTRTRIIVPQLLYFAKLIF